MFVIMLTAQDGKQTFKLASRRVDAEAFWTELVIRVSDSTHGEGAVVRLVMFEDPAVETEGQARLVAFEGKFTKIKGVTIRGMPSLMGKVRRGGLKAISPDCLAKAEADIAARTEDYLTWLAQDLADLDQFLGGAKSGEYTPAEALRGLELCAYRIKGQGGMFGYTLVTAIAAKMYDYLDHLETELDLRDLDVVRVQGDALRVVAARKLSGNGGADGALLMSEMEAMVDKVLSKKGDVVPRSARGPKA